MNRRELKYLKTILLIILMIELTSIVTATDISGPINITSPGVYNVVNDIFCNGACINIDSDDVILDGNGYLLWRIAGNDGIWVNVNSPSDITIRNFGNIFGFGQGIETRGNGIKITGNKFSNNYCAISNPSNYSTISSNKFLNNNICIIDAGSTGQNNITNNLFMNNNDGIWFASVSGKVLGNTFLNSSRSVFFPIISRPFYGTIYVYNNYFGDASNVSFLNLSQFYSTLFLTNPAGPTPGLNVVNGPYIAGNYWSNPNGSGWSDLQPSNELGYTTIPYKVVEGKYDTAPLVRYSSTCSIFANFSANQTAGVLPFTINFTDLSNGNPNYWLWNFGDGNLSTDQNPNHTYSSAGNFTVNLSAYYIFCSDSKNVTEYVHVMKTADNLSGISNAGIPIINNSNFYNKNSDILWDLNNQSQIVQEDYHSALHVNASNPCLLVANFSSNQSSGITPLTINFTDLSSGDPDIWFWNFGDDDISTKQNPVHTYLSVGNYSVNFTASKSLCFDTKTNKNYINVTKPIITPVANFTVNKTSGTIPLYVKFSDQSSNNPTSWFWTFGDGVNLTDQNPVHTYSTAGLYTVNLTATNSAGSDTKTAPDYINASKEILKPVASFTGSPRNGTIPLSVQFTDMSSNNPSSWFWTFGDGGNSAAHNPAHIYSTAGVYTVNLTATNSVGSDTKNEPDYISATKEVLKPVASFTGSPRNGPIPLLVQFSDHSTNNPASWFWTFGDGANSTIQNPTHTYSTLGVYTVNLTATNTAGSDTKAEPDYINATKEILKPVASFTGSPRTGSIPLTTQFTDNSTNTPTSWLWTFGDGINTTIQNPAHTYSTAGVYTVNLTATNTAGSDTKTEPDYINPISGAYQINATADKYTIVYPNGIKTWLAGSNKTYLTQAKPGSDLNDVLVDNESEGSIESWSFTQISSDHNISTFGSYTPGQVQAFFSVSPTLGKAPLTVQLTDQSIGSPTNYYWQFGDGSISREKNPVHTYITTGTFTISLKVSNDKSSGTGVWNNCVTVQG